jgi:hypothetical protein
MIGIEAALDQLGVQGDAMTTVIPVINSKCALRLAGSANG